MVLSLVGFRKPQVARVVRTYFSNRQIIVAPMHCAPTGVYFEQATPIVLPAPSSRMALGAAFRDAFDLFSVADHDLAGTRKSDWPAFRASELRSIKEFERTYVPMLCEALNPSNAVVRASVVHPIDATLEITTSFNPLLDPEEIGAILFRLADAARRG